MNLPFWIEIALYIGVVQGLFLGLLLPRIAKSNAAANRLLAGILILASLWVTLYLNTLYYPVLPPQAQAFLDTFAFLFGPLFYFYLKTLLFFDEKVRFKAIHFIPAFIHFVYGLSNFRFSPQKFSTLVAQGSLRAEWFFFFCILMFAIFGYWLACVNLVVRFKKHEPKVILFKQNLTYLIVLLTALFIGYVTCVFFSLDFFFGIKVFAFTGPNIGWIIIPVLVYFISYFALVQPEVLKVNYQIDKKPLARITNGELAFFKNKLEVVMMKDKLFLEPLLKLNDVAEKIELDTTRFSWLINEEYGCNFYDFINKYRIDEFVQRVKNEAHKSQTLESLAYDVGFNSKTTFNKTFKKFFQNTPREYVRKLSSTQIVPNI